MVSFVLSTTFCYIICNVPDFLNLLINLRKLNCERKKLIVRTLEQKSVNCPNPVLIPLNAITIVFPLAFLSLILKYL